MSDTGLLVWGAALLFAAGAVAAIFLRRKKKLFFRVSEIPWAIGMYSGPSPHELAPVPGVTNPVLSARDVTDVRARFVADPFMIRTDDGWNMFFEILNAERKTGEIACASSQDGLKWNYQQVVLEEPFHLSYPYVFSWEGVYYMIPETGRARAIRLYQADRFPTQWRHIGNIMDNVEYVDASIFRHADRWWLLTTRSYPNSDTLFLYSSEDLLGDWVEHPKSPVIESDLGSSRPAGRVLVTPDSIIRYAQNLDGGYGLDVKAFEITRLTSTDYEERPLRDGQPVVGRTGNGWNGAGMHHVDAHQTAAGSWLAVVDGRGEERLYGPARRPWRRSTRIPD